MKDNDRLNKLFESARSEKPIFKMEQIENLVKSGQKVSAKKIKLGNSGRGLFNPLNLIIMISTLAIIVTSLFFAFNGTQEMPQERHQVPASAGMTDRSIQQQKIANENVPGSSPWQAIPAEAGTSAQSTVALTNDLPENSSMSPAMETDETSEDLLSRDTIIKGRILHLKKKELEKIGFYFDENGYYYLNKLDDGSKVNLWSYSNREPGKSASSVGFGRGGFVNPVISKDPTERDYYPVCTSDLNGEDIRMMRGLPDDFLNKFEYYNDTLVPVILSWSELGGKQGENRLAWFKVSDNFFSDLGPSYTMQKEPNHDGYRVVFDFSYAQLNIGTAISLNYSLINSMGFSISADSMVYRYGNSIEFWFTAFGSGVQSLGGNVESDQTDDLSKAMLCAVTNVETNMSMNVNPKAFYKVDSTINGDNWIDVCVPIRFTNSSGQLWEGNTFWFYPNENLFNSLPDSIGEPMRREYKTNVEPKIKVIELNIVEVAKDSEPDNKKSFEPVPCEYFPTFCEGLPGVDNISVFPNPTRDYLNVELILSRAKRIDMRVFEISGRLMIDELETLNYEDGGMFRERIDLSSLKEGFYLLVLTDDEGAKMTRRIIKN